MGAQATENPFETFVDPRTGQALSDGYIYFGEPELDPVANPIAIYWDEDLMIPAQQPVRTNAGYIWRNGAPARVWVDGNYSMLVKDRQGRQVFYAPNWTAASSANVVFRQAGVGAVVRSVQSRLREVVSVKDFGAVGDGVTDDYPAMLLALNYFKTFNIGSGVLFFPRGTYRMNTAMTVTNTHGIEFKGEAPAYTPGAEGALSVINFYGGTTAAFTLTGPIATQSSFRFTNLKVENKGNPDTGNGILVSAAAFTGGLEVTGCVFTRFSTGVNSATGSATSYQYFENNAFYDNATWGVLAQGDNLSFINNSISNNGPDWTTAPNTFNAAAVGGGVYISGMATNVAFRGNNIEGHTVGIFLNSVYGVTIDSNYFEAVAQASIQAMSIVGMEITGNYHNPNTESRTILLSGVSGVRIANAGYSPQIYLLGVTDYDLVGSLYFLEATLNRAVNDKEYIMKSRYESQNIVEDYKTANYLAAPTTVVGMAGPTLQTEVGPHGAVINRYVATAGGYFDSPTFSATTGEFIYFSLLVRNVDLFTVAVRNAGLTQTICVKSIVQYNTEWSILTVGGQAPTTEPFGLRFVTTNACTFDIGGLVVFTSATPIERQPFCWEKKQLQADSALLKSLRVEGVVRKDGQYYWSNNATTALLDTHFFFTNANGNVGSITTTGSTTAYNTSSDYRLKQDVQPMTGALARNALLKPVTFKWKVDGANGEGFIAHELQAVLPEAVSGAKDAVDAHGNPVYQGVDTSALAAHFTACIEELKAEIDLLKAAQSAA
jgi:hypothetical protein